MYLRSGGGWHSCPNSLPSDPHALALDERSGLWYCPIEYGAEQAKEYRERLAAEEAEQTVTKLGHIIRDGITVEEGDTHGNSIKPGTLTEEQIDWLASWLAGEGVTYKESETR